MTAPNVGVPHLDVAPIATVMQSISIFDAVSIDLPAPIISLSRTIMQPAAAAGCVDPLETVLATSIKNRSLFLINVGSDSGAGILQYRVDSCSIREVIFKRDMADGTFNIKHYPNIWDSMKDQEEDMVNSPTHYTVGNTEVIDVIENAVSGSDDPIAAVLQGNVIKYILRMWFKGNELQDAKKARWYLDRLIEKLEINNEQT